MVIIGNVQYGVKRPHGVPLVQASRHGPHRRAPAAWNSRRVGLGILSNAFDGSTSFTSGSLDPCSRNASVVGSHDLTGGDFESAGKRKEDVFLSLSASSTTEGEKGRRGAGGDDQERLDAGSVDRDGSFVQENRELHVGSNGSNKRATNDENDMVGEIMEMSMESISNGSIASTKSKMAGQASGKVLDEENGKAHKQQRKKSNRQRRAEVKARADAADAARAARKVAAASAAIVDGGIMIYPPNDQRAVKSSWERLMRWSRSLRSRAKAEKSVGQLEKVVIFGGGSFGTAMGVAIARQHPNVKIVLLLRDPYLCRDINQKHRNTRYLPDDELPDTVTATTCAAEAISGAQFAIHAVPVQHSRAFLASIKDVLPADLPLISVSKGVEVTTGQVMSDLIPSALGRRQPAAFLSGPSFAKEVMAQRPTGIVAASRDKALSRKVQWLFASSTMRVSTSNDVIGVEICGALKNVLAIAAGIVEGLNLGNNAMAALIAQGCAEIRWLAEKMGAKPATVSGLSGLGDIMLTCYGSLSRNRSVGVRLGQGEALKDILESSSQVAEGVATAAVVVSLARRFRVQLPVLTAVAQVLEGHISAAEAVAEIMNLPQVEER